MLASCLASACSWAAAREEAFVRDNLASLPGVEAVQVSCASGWLVSHADVCVTVHMSEGIRLVFSGVGYDSFGAVPSAVQVMAAAGRTPLVVSCDTQTEAAAVGRFGMFGHHFTPALEGVPEAIRRRREVIKYLEFWPQCPQFWEVADKSGTTYRYCAHASGEAAEPPPRPCN
jgi:hypothetical protein